MDATTKSFFISYAREDSDFALQLARDLRTAGADLWIDQLDIRAGERWDRSIERALETCSGMMLILSPDSVGSPNVLDEVSYGLDEGKRIIPVMHRECKLPFRLRRFQYIDFTSSYEAGFKRLVRDIRSKLPAQGVINQTVPQTADKSVQVEKTIRTGAESPVLDQRSTQSGSSGSSINRWLGILAGIAGMLVLAFFAYRYFKKPGPPVENQLEIVERDGKFGYAKPNGAVVIQFQFDEANPFQQGKAEVRVGDHFFLINEDGDCVEGCSDPETEAWDRAKQADTRSAYEEFLSAFPDGSHADEARRYLVRAQEKPAEDEVRSDEQRAWDAALNRDNIPAYERFLRTFPNSRFAMEAENRIAELGAEMEESDWNKVIQENSIHAYKIYLEHYPQGKYAEVAESRIRRLEEAAAESGGSNEQVVGMVDKQPEFPGGLRRLANFLAGQIEYPPTPRREGIEGRVLLNYIVEKDGSISDINAIDSPHPDLTQEAIRVFGQLNEQGIRFQPGEKGGEAVRARMVFPVTFSLN